MKEFNVFFFCYLKEIFVFEVKAINVEKNLVLVTGGAGFVGSHLCELLAKNNANEVYSLDNYFTGSKENHVPNVNYIEGSTSDIDRLVMFSLSHSLSSR